MKAREGDLIEDINDSIFDVKGLVHPPDRIIAFPRFVLNPNGERRRADVSYSKVYALSERFAFLKEKFPQYLVYDKVFDNRLCEVPIEALKNHYHPVERLQNLHREDKLDSVERQALRFIKILKEKANISWSKLGISGSILVGLHTPTSDIDPVVYGSESCRKACAALKLLLEDKKNPVKPYSSDGLRKLFDFRSKDTVTSFEDFVRTESRKILQGTFMGRDYFIRFVKDWNEVEEEYGAIQYKSVGYAKIRATVVDDSERNFTPCCYKVEDVKFLNGIPVQTIEEIVSFRGRFCEQAKNGETVVAQGKVERVQKLGEREHYRLLLGNKISDHMILT
jgi:hypothetical protein